MLLFWILRYSYSYCISLSNVRAYYDAMACTTFKFVSWLFFSDICIQKHALSDHIQFIKQLYNHKIARSMREVQNNKLCSQKWKKWQLYRKISNSSNSNEIFILWGLVTRPSSCMVYILTLYNLCLNVQFLKLSTILIILAILCSI